MRGWEVEKVGSSAFYLSFGICELIYKYSMISSLSPCFPKI
jgi:hypothetical protein